MTNSENTSLIYLNTFLKHFSKISNEQINISIWPILEKHCERSSSKKNRLEFISKVTVFYGEIL